METKQIIQSIKEKQANIKSVFYVGCGASKAELYPAVYFLRDNAKDLRIEHYTANEFNYATPKSLNETAIVITASLGGTTPETVAATKLARQMGAHVVALSNVADSAILQEAEYTIAHGFAESYAAKTEKMTLAMSLATEILNEFEGFEHYEDMQKGYENIYPLINKAAEMALPSALKFAERHKDEETIYVMSSGATNEVAYSTSICLWLEMQWIHSSSFHSGEYFHGPFEITEKGVPFMLLMNDGKTRHLDARALTFLNRFDAEVTLIDSKDYGLNTVIPETVIDYFNPMLQTGVIRVHAEQLSYARKHPLTKRRYMWKLEY